MARHACERGDAPAYTFLLDGESKQEIITFGQLHRRAAAFAAELGEIGMDGERAVILYPPGIDYIVAFFGCLYARAIAVPAYPPHGSRMMGRLRAIVADAEPKAVLASAAIRQMVLDGADPLRWLGAVSWFTEVGRDDATPCDPDAEDINPDAIAFLQYTSGSTADPKGVVLTHANLLHNERLIANAFGHTSNSRIVGWLPPYHDMGLIGNILQPLYLGVSCVLLSPAHVVQKPLRWLRAISEHRATTSGGPDFAYDLCCRKIDAADVAGLDLSCWRVAFNGAEPVRAATLESFSAVFRDAGFDRRAFYPCYGLAEASLIVSGGEAFAPPRVVTCDADQLANGRGIAIEGSGKKLVGCGRSLSDQDVAVVSEATGGRLPEGAVGEIWVSGPSVASGYWNRPEQSHATFSATVRGGDERRYLRTGDLGFLFHGELYVTGRIKDLIILRGGNFYPSDIEATVERSHRALRIGGCAAISISVDGDEALVVIQELEFRQKPALPEVLMALRAALAQQHGVKPASILIIKPGGLPKTSSGKIQRGRCRAIYNAGEFEPLARWDRDGAPASEAVIAPWETSAEDFDTWFARLIASKLKLQLSAIDNQRSLANYGLDSLGALELAHELQRTWGIAAGSEIFFEARSIENLRVAFAVTARRSGEVEAGVIRAIEDGAEFPLSYRQRGIWLAEQRHGSAGLVLTKALDVRGSTTPELASRLRRVFLRHPMLRARLVRRDAGFVQRIDATADGQLEVHAPQDGLSDALLAQLRAGAQRPFAVDGPLVRAGLYPLGGDRHLVFLQAHHLVADLWSFVLLLEEVFGADGIAPATATYRDFVQHEHRAVARVDNSSERYWRTQLGGGVTPLDFPFRCSGAAAGLRQAGRQKITLDARTMAALRAMVQRHGCTLNTVLLAAYKVLLFRHTRQPKIAVGCFASGRDRPEWASVVGCFVNPLVVCSEIEPGVRFVTFLLQVKANLAAGLRHQDYPFDRLVETLRPAGGHLPFINVVFSLLRPQASAAADWSTVIADETGSAITHSGLTVASLDLGPVGSTYDLALFASECGDVTTLSAEYDAAMLSAEEIVDFLRSYEQLLRSIADDEQQTLGALRIVSPEQRAVLLDEWNEIAVAPDDGAMVQDLFQARVAAAPKATALIAEGRAISYAELNEWANAVAHGLTVQGVPTGSVVALLLDRSVEAVAGMLGILSAGCAYVPIDPAFPAARIAELLADSGAQAVVSLRRHRELASPDSVFIGVDDLNVPALSGQRVAPPRRFGLAYVMYTSGSTGRPKGVAGTQAGIVNRLQWMWWNFPFQADDVCCLKTSLSFVDSVCELFGPLLQGVPSVVLADATVKDPAALAEALATARVTRVVLVPTLLQLLLQLPAARVARLACVRQWVSSGEPLPRVLLQRLLHHFPDCVCLNIYGSTEVAADVSCRVASAADAAGPGRNVSIGRAIAQTRLYVLAPDGEFCPFGAEGELYVSGRGVAEGYLNRPELTADKFVRDPFRPGERMFRSGDRARKFRDGQIDLLGRMDHQIKIRGQRVELGEIEASLQAGVGITHAAVTYERDEPELTAYVECAVEPDLAAWRTRMADTLPAYMMPTRYYRVERMPLTVSGKVDRTKLSVIAVQPILSPLSEPADPLETKLLGLWREVLGRGDLGVEDNFFHLGGSSVGAVRLAAQIERETGQKTGIADVFRRPTVRQMAAGLTEQSVAPSAAAREGAMVRATASQHQIFIHQSVDPQSTDYNMPGLFFCRTEVDIERLIAAARSVVAHQPALRTAFRLGSGELWSEVRDVELAVPVVSCPAQDLVEIQRSFVRPFDLSQPPLLRFQIVRQPGALVLCFDLHHIVADADSVRIFFRDFSAAFAGHVPVPLRRHYVDHAREEQAQAERAPTQEAIRWWREYLPSAAPELALRGPTTSGSAPAVVRWSIGAQDAARLRAAATANEATLFMTLLAAWGLVLRAYTGHSAFVVGTNMTQRNVAGDEDVIGVFINPLPLRLDVEADASLAQTIGQVRCSCLQAYEHADVPFSVLCEALGNREAGGVKPLFQTKLQLTPRLVPEIILDGHGLEYVPVDTARARTDLQWNIEMEPEGGLGGQLEYDSGRIDAELAGEYAAAFAVAVAALAKADAAGTVADACAAIDACRRQQQETRAALYRRKLHVKLAHNHRSSKIK